MANYLYIRGLKQVDHTVFSVVDGQKKYRSPFNGRMQPYSSGQQVKRSLLDAMIANIEGAQRAPITFNYEIKTVKGEQIASQKEPWNPCDPSYADQLIGGWMRAEKGMGTIKRRSPLSISAMRPLHPSLANLEDNESGTFDRSDSPDQHIVKVRDEKGNELSPEEIEAFLSGQDRSLPMRNWLDLGPRANGIFVFDIAIDLDRLFMVSTNQYDPALTTDKIEELKKEGWIATETHLIAPQVLRESIMPALAKAIVEWRITSNQSRTFNPQGTLAIAISNNANSIINAIRADLKDDNPYAAEPIIDDSIDGVHTFVAPAARGYIQDVPARSDAMQAAEDTILASLRAATEQLTVS